MEDHKEGRDKRAAEERVAEACARLVREAWEAGVEPGCLYLVGTPLGNLQDLSPRVLSVLAQVDSIAAEDTRRTRILLTACGLSGHPVSYHRHNEQEMTARIVARLQAGETWALVTDAGMPAISDPGQVLCAACHAAGIPVRVIPGPSAVPTAVAGSGLVTGGFVFEGFLPVSGKKRREALASVRAQTLPVVIYEAPHRLEKTVEDLLALGLGALEVCLARELTKRYEEFRRGSLSDLAEEMKRQPEWIRGELVLVLAAPADLPLSRQDAAEETDAGREAEIRAALAAALDTGCGGKKAARRVAQTFGLPVREVYARLHDAEGL